MEIGYKGKNDKWGGWMKKNVRHTSIGRGKKVKYTWRMISVEGKVCFKTSFFFPFYIPAHVLKNRVGDAEIK